MFHYNLKFLKFVLMRIKLKNTFQQSIFSAVVLFFVKSKIALV